MAAVLVVVQASVFTTSVLRRARPAFGFAVMLAGLFGFLYGRLGVESHPLVIGSISLFSVLCLIMALTQRVARREMKAV